MARSDSKVILGDCAKILRRMDPWIVDAVVTDPPAGIAFMGKGWDKFKGRSRFIDFLTERLSECLRSAKPGAVLLCWSLPRTSHWTGTAVEDAGWQIEDRISHLFGQGFPKHKSKLKPACEDWWLARKPGPKWLGVEACRIEAGSRPLLERRPNGVPGNSLRGSLDAYLNGSVVVGTTTAGRWPANVTLDEEAGALLDEQAGDRKAGVAVGRNASAGSVYGNGKGLLSQAKGVDRIGYGGDGGPSRFFYCSKASRKNRGDGNTHPTVKSTALMRWLCRLACPPEGIILDPFTGSGSTGVACIAQGFEFLGIEANPKYHTIAERRLAEAHVKYPPSDPELCLFP